MIVRFLPFTVPLYVASKLREESLFVWILVFSTLITEPSPVAKTALEPLELDVILLPLMLIWLPSIPRITAFWPRKLLLSSLVVLPVLSKTLFSIFTTALFLPMKAFWSDVVLVINSWAIDLFSVIIDVPVKVLGSTSACVSAAKVGMKANVDKAAPNTAGSTQRRNFLYCMLFLCVLCFFFMVVLFIISISKML